MLTDEHRDAEHGADLRPDAGHSLAEAQHQEPAAEQHADLVVERAALRTEVPRPAGLAAEQGAVEGAQPASGPRLSPPSPVSAAAPSRRSATMSPNRSCSSARPVPAPPPTAGDGGCRSDALPVVQNSGGTSTGTVTFESPDLGVTGVSLEPGQRFEQQITLPAAGQYTATTNKTPNDTLTIVVAEPAAPPAETTATGARVITVNAVNFIFSPGCNQVTAGETIDSSSTTATMKNTTWSGSSAKVSIC